MLSFILRRCVQSVLVLWLMSVIVFAGIYIVGDPTAMMIPDSVTPEMREQMVAALGLDRSAFQQYLDFVGKLVHGSLGRSFVTGLPVGDMIGSRLTATMELAVAAMLIAVVIGLAMVNLFRPGDGVNPELAQQLLAQHIGS